MKQYIKFGAVILLLTIILTYTNNIQANPKANQVEKGDVYTYSFSNDLVLKGVGSTEYEYFSLGNWKINNAKLILKIDSSTITSKGLILKVESNSNIIYNKKIKKIKGVQTIEIPIHPDFITTTEINYLRFCFDSEGETIACSDGEMPSVWATILKESKLVVDYKPLTKVKDADTFYKKFLSLEALYKKQSGICVFSNANEKELTAAANVLTEMSSNAKELYQNISLNLIDDEEDIEKIQYPILICEYDKLPNEIKKELLVLDEKSIEKELLVKLVMNNKNPMLVMTGNLEKLLREEALIKDKPLQYFELTKQDQKTTGYFKRNITFEINMANNREIAFSSQLDLDMEYSEELDFSRSFVTVLINDTPVGSKSLSKEKSKGDNIFVDIPKDINAKGKFLITVSFYLYDDDNWCNADEESIPYGIVKNTSMIKLVTRDVLEMGFSSFPSPFIRDKLKNDVYVVIPAQYTKEDILAMTTILLTMGRFVEKSEGVLHVAFDNDNSYLNNGNIIAIGKVDKNNLINNNRNRLKSYQNIDSDFGIGTIFASPYSRNYKGFMIVTGNTYEGLLKSANVFKNASELGKVTGNFYVVDEEIENYNIPVDFELGMNPVEFVEQLVDKTVPIEFYSMLVVILTATILLIVKYAKRKG